MKKEQQILNKLAKYNEVQKVELSAEPMKVELADVNELSQFTKQIMSQVGKIEDAHKSALNKVALVKKAKQDAKQDVNELAKNTSGLDADMQRLEGALSRFVADAKKLGINPKEVREVVVAEKAVAIAKGTVNQYSRFADDMSKSLIG